ncbi:GRF1-interacting factor 1-like protein [Tanacetum coccineum]
MTSSSKTNSPNYKRKTTRISVKSPTYVNLESSREEQKNERTPSPPPRKKYLSPPHASLKSTSSRSTYQSSSSSPSELRKGKAKVAWEAVCVPKVEDGLGNGMDTFALFDNWCPHGPLSNIVSNKDIYRSGFIHNVKVADVVNNNMWPTEWSSKYLLLNNIVMPHLSKAKDELFWKDLENKEVKFLVFVVWENIQPRSIEVDWFSMVWFSQQIPRHAILLWLIIKRKLKTQDMLRQWNVTPGITLSSLMCPLCETQKDSHEHLFFDCRFSKQVWTHVKSLSGISNIPAGLSNIVDFLIPLAKKKSARCVIAKLLNQ